MDETAVNLRHFGFEQAELKVEEYHD